MNQFLLGLSKKYGLLACAILCWLGVPVRAQETATPLRVKAVNSFQHAVSVEAGLMAYIGRDPRKGGWSIGMLSLKTGKESAKPVQKQPIRSLTFSKDGKTLAWVNSDGMIVLHDLASGQERSVTYREPVRKDQELWFETLTLSPDGKIGVINGYEGVQFVDLASGKLTAGDPISATPTDRILLSPDGKTAYIKPQGYDRIEVYEVATKKHLRTLSAEADIRYCALSPDGATLAITEPQFTQGQTNVRALLQKHIVLWDPIANKEKAKFRLAPPLEAGRSLGPIAFSQDGMTLAYAYEHRAQLKDVSKPAIGFVDAATGRPLGAMLVKERPSWLSFMPDGKSIVLVPDWRNGYVDVYGVPALKAPAKDVAVAADLFVKGSIWFSEQPNRTFTILERKSETFRARFLDSYFDREITGTIKDSKILWRAKDVQATRGGKGGDTEGTIFADGSIDFFGQLGKEDPGRYTLKLKKSP